MQTVAPAEKKLFLNLMKVFDYIFYRIAKFYYKKDGLSAYSAVTLLSFMQASIFGELLFIIIRIFIPISDTAKHAKHIGIIGVFILIIVMYLNTNRYKNMYWKLSERWKNSDTKSMYWIKGVLIVIANFLPYIILILMSEIEFL